MRPISPLRSDARRGARAQQQCGPGIARRPCRDREYIQYPGQVHFAKRRHETLHCPGPARRTKCWFRSWSPTPLRTFDSVLLRLTRSPRTPRARAVPAHSHSQARHPAASHAVRAHPLMRGAGGVDQPPPIPGELDANRLYQQIRPCPRVLLLFAFGTALFLSARIVRQHWDLICHVRLRCSAQPYA